MIITRKMLNEIEQNYRKSFPQEFKQYVLVNYAEEPFPYEYSEQDLYEHIRRDIRDYDQGNLDIAVKSPSERWQEERDYLQTLCREQSSKIRDREDYILELEHVLAENGLETPRMANHRLEKGDVSF
ncbi:hypothetical protein [Desulfosporosinus youngiae]|uniref:Uncharacterized protein n=1 Tax=Desulfosporosinus youngiae DSM 17734 TaxID=768710 RepID=H5XTJ7_9FIRM|nr:hypothetical protein [Desulfosporosinus youngiae]EHQ88596.1 hypothetical protein DesyoDRAFT_1441 [Desulfosporosinus youngiae DSM 17734]